MNTEDTYTHTKDNNILFKGIKKLRVCSNMKKNTIDYVQEITQSHTADQPMVP